MMKINFELGGKTVQVCPKSGTVMIEGKEAGYKVDPKKALTDVFAELAQKMGVKNEPKHGTISLHDALEDVKDKLKDAPVEVKASFNNIVKHLDEHKSEKDSEKTPEKKEDAPKEEPKEEPKSSPEKEEPKN